MHHLILEDSRKVEPKPQQPITKIKSILKSQEEPPAKEKPEPSAKTNAQSRDNSTGKK